MSDPLAGLFEEDPLGDLFTEEGTPDPQLSTATGRRQYDMENIQRNLSALRALLARPKLSASRKQAIQRQIAELERQMSGGAKEGQALRNVVRGAQAGALSGTMLPLQAVAGFVPGAPGRAIRGRIQEAQAGIQEEIDPEGKAGMAGQFAGSLVTGTPGFGALANVPLRIAAKGTGRVAQAAAKAIAPKAGLGARVAGNVAGGVPLNLGFETGTAMDAPDDETPEERLERKKRALLNLGIGTAADIVFGTIPAGAFTRRPKTGTPKVAVDPNAPVAQERIGDIEKMKAEGAERIRAKELSKEIQRRARLEWEAANLDAKWKNVPKEDKKRIVGAYKARIDLGDVAAPPGYVRPQGAEAQDAAQPVVGTKATPVTDSNLNKPERDVLDRYQQPGETVRGPGFVATAANIGGAPVTDDIAVRIAKLQAAADSPDISENVRAVLRQKIAQLQGQTAEIPSAKPRTAEDDAESARRAADLPPEFAPLFDESTEAGQLANQAATITESKKEFLGDDFQPLMETISDYHAQGNIPLLKTYLQAIDNVDKPLPVKTPEQAAADEALIAEQSEGFNEAMNARTGESPIDATLKFTEQQAVPPVHMAIFDNDGIVETVSLEQLEAADNHHSLAFSEEALRHEDGGAIAYRTAYDTQVVVGPESTLTDEAIRQRLIETGLMDENVTVIRKTSDPRGEDTVTKLSTDSPPATTSQPATPAPKAAPNATALKEASEDELQDAFDALQDRIIADPSDVEAREQVEVIGTELVERRRGRDYGALTPEEQARLEQVRAARKGAETIRPEQPLMDEGRIPPSGFGAAAKDAMPTQEAVTQAVDAVGAERLQAEVQARMDELGLPPGHPSEASITESVARQVVGQQSVEPVVERQPMKTARYRKAYNTKPDRLDDQTLADLIDELDSRMSGNSLMENKENGYLTKWAELLEEAANRAKTPEAQARAEAGRALAEGKIVLSRPEGEGEGGLTFDESNEAKRLARGFRDVESPPAIGGFIAGFTAGLVGTDDESDRLTNALMWGMIGAGGAYGLKKVFDIRQVQKAARRTLLPGQRPIRDMVVSTSDIAPERISFFERQRRIYTGLARQTFGLDRAASTLGVQKAPAAQNFAKLASVFGRWSGMAHNALSWGPRLLDGVTKLDAPSMADILDVGRQAGRTDLQGFIDDLDDLMVARTTLENIGKGTPLVSPVNAELYFRNAPEYLHVAADMMRKYHLALAQVLADGGVMPKDIHKVFADERYYAPLHRIFGGEKMPSLTKGPDGKWVASANPIKHRKGGSKLAIKSPTDATMDLTAAVYRAAEMNRIKMLMLAAWEANGKPNELLRYVKKSDAPNTSEFDAQVAYLRQEIADLKESEAQELVAALNPRALDSNAGTMTVYRNGVLETYKADANIIDSFLALGISDSEALVRMLGNKETLAAAVAAPARIARVGVTAHPYFLGKMALLDNWQVFMNTRYGFRPGIDWIRGWLHAVRHSDEYKNLLAGGGSHSSIVSYEYTQSKTAGPALLAEGATPIHTAVNQIKQMKPLEAWRTLVTPLAEAARVGEYLRARDHGADVIEAVFAAKTVAGNYSTSGSWAVIKAANSASLFTRPAIQALDQAVYSSGLHPFRPHEDGRTKAALWYFSKGIATIAAPSALFWYVNKDDQEINDLRAAEGGKRFWFVRMPYSVPGIDEGTLIKIPKPIFEGQIFGTTMEAMLDEQYKKDPQAIEMAFSQVIRDASVNMLPLIGVVPMQIMQGEGVLGSPLYPRSDEQFALEHRGEVKASWFARTLSKSMAPAFENTQIRLLKNGVTPAGIDHIFNSVTGMLGQDAMRALTWAMDAEEKGYVPAKHELPVVGRLFADYPTMAVGPVREFYKRADKVQQVGRTIDHLALERPGDLVRYMSEHQKEQMLIGTYAQSRQTIANFTRAIHDVRIMPKEYATDAERREIIKHYMTTIIETARTANQLARMIDEKE